MRVLVGMECSGRTREAFRRRGHDAYSCDLLPSEDNSPYHIIGDVFDHIDEEWDLGIFHPTCTFLTLASIRWMYHPEDTHLDPWLRRRHPKYPNRYRDFLDACNTFHRIQRCKIPKFAIENPTPHGLATASIGPYTQKAQPYWFGDPFTKGLCLWLYNLPQLVPTNMLTEYEAKCHKMPPGKDRAKERSRTEPGVAEAFAEQWG